jgi:DNA-binding CsgD family transcriptional regulator
MIYYRLRISLFLLFACLVFTNARNIPFVPSVYNYNTRDYKAGNQNWAMGQGHDGVMYIGNNNGLLRFDGTNWDLHKLPNGLSVKSIFIDTSDRTEKIYVGSFEEFGYFITDNANQLVYQSLTSLLDDYEFRNDEIWTIHKHEENIYFQSFRSYFVYNEAKSEISHAQPFPAPLYFFEANGQIFSQLIDDDFYRLKNNDFEHLFSKQLINNDYIVSVIPFGNSYLLVSSENGIFEYNPEKNTVLARETAIDNRLKSGIANRAIKTADFTIVIGTLKEGVFAINRDGTQKWHLNHQNGLNNNTVLALFSDKESNIWVALDNGISYIQYNSGLSFFEPAEPQLGLVEDILLHHDNLYLATNHGIYNYLQEGETMRRLWGLDAQSWFIRRFGEQIITGNNSGTAFIENDRSTAVATTGGTDIKQALLHNQDVLIEATYHNLYIYKKNEQGKWAFSHRVGNFYDLISRIEIDHAGNIWAQHMYRGIYRLRLNEILDSVTELTYFRHLAPDDTTATKISVMKLMGRIVLSDGKTFYTYDDIERRIVPYEQLNIDLQGFEDAGRIVTVNDSLFWFVRENEYSLIGFRNNGYFIRKKIPFAILNNPPNTGRGNVYAGENNISYLALNGGIARFSLEHTFDKPVDRLRLRAVSSYNRSSNTRNSLIINGCTGVGAINYADNDITFEFQYTDFSRKIFTIESYLEKYDLRWITVGDDLKISYINLPAGDYTLHARVVNDFGQELSTLSFSFRIKQPHYKTSRAIALYLFVVLFAVYFSMEKYTKRIIRKKNRLFAQQEKDRLAQIDRQEKMITALENERLESDLLHKSKELASATMIIINHSEFLDKLKNEVKTYIHSGKINKTEGNKLLGLLAEKHSKEDDWAIFKENFDLIYENFFGRLQTRYPSLTPTDLKLCALLSLNYSSKEIANMLNLTIRGVEAGRYRLRKKLNLSEEENLVSFIMEFR